MFDCTGIAVRLKRSDSLLQPLQLVLQLKVCQLTSCMLSIARPNVMKQTPLNSMFGAVVVLVATRRHL
jgi:hypothetical protein